MTLRLTWPQPPEVPLAFVMPALSPEVEMAWRAIYDACARADLIEAEMKDSQP